MEKLKYPIGRFAWPAEVTADDRKRAKSILATFPEKLSMTVQGLTDVQLGTPYRPGGWTVRQVVHHVADSHMNAYIRFKLALTEDNPTIKPYHEASWALLSDSLLPPSVSLPVLTGVHTRWLEIMKHMEEADWDRSFFHPENKRYMRLCQVLMLYGWHSEHHLAHIHMALRS